MPKRLNLFLPIIALAVLAIAQPAAARAPLSQLRELRAGTAIVQYDAKRTSARTLTRLAGGARIQRFRALPFVTARGPAASLRRLGRLAASPPST